MSNENNSLNNELITATESALSQISKFLSGSRYIAVRLDVKKNGCAGLGYSLSGAAKKDEEDVEIQLSDNIKLFINEMFVPLLKGTIIDYMEQNFKSEFVFNNPNARGKCGCGTSFYV